MGGCVWCTFHNRHSRHIRSLEPHSPSGTSPTAALAARKAAPDVPSDRSRSAPFGLTLAPVAVVQKAKPAPHGWTIYTVRSGDTLASHRRPRTAPRPACSSPRNHLRHGGNQLPSASACRSPGPRPGPGTAAKARPRTPAPSRRQGRSDPPRDLRRALRRHAERHRGQARRHAGRPAQGQPPVGSRSVLQVGQKAAGPRRGARQRPPSGARRRHGRHHAAYRVRSGDTLSAIATRTGTPLSSLLRHEPPLEPRSVIHPGQVLGSGQGPRHTRTATRAAAVTTTRRAYTVRSGDTLSAIAVRHGTTQAAMLKANRLRQRQPPEVGQRLLDPGARSSSTARQRQHLRRPHLPQLHRQRGQPQPRRPAPARGSPAAARPRR